MARIYSNAYITILASNASDAAHGFLADRIADKAPDARIPFRVALNKFGSITARKYVSRSSYERSNNPLSTRAWALQEEMMASRILNYTEHTLQWRCASNMMNLNDSLNVVKRYNSMTKLISQLSKDPEEALSDWSRIVQRYSHRNMSIQSDKLPAIAALAERFATVLGHYYAGLWQYGLIKQLCWEPSSSSRERRGDLYKAPSWSWASAGHLSLAMANTVAAEDCCNLSSVKVLRKNAEVPYGEVVHASIKICGKIIIASVETSARRRFLMCTLIHSDTGVTEPPLKRFYKTYFHHDTIGAVLSRGTAFEVDFFWDYEEFRSDPMIIREFSPTLTSSGEQL